METFLRKEEQYWAQSRTASGLRGPRTAVRKDLPPLTGATPRSQARAMQVRHSNLPTTFLGFLSKSLTRAHLLHRAHNQPGVPQLSRVCPFPTPTESLPPGLPPAGCRLPQPRNGQWPLVPDLRRARTFLHRLLPGQRNQGQPVAARGRQHLHHKRVLIPSF